MQIITVGKKINSLLKIDTVPSGKEDNFLDLADEKWMQ